MGLQVCVLKPPSSVPEVHVADALTCNACNCDDSICNVKATSEEALSVHSEGKKHRNKVKASVGKVTGSETVDQETKLAETNAGRNKSVLQLPAASNAAAVIKRVGKQQENGPASASQARDANNSSIPEGSGEAGELKLETKEKSGVDFGVASISPTAQYEVINGGYPERHKKSKKSADKSAKAAEEVDNGDWSKAGAETVDSKQVVSEEVGQTKVGRSRKGQNEDFRRLAGNESVNGGHEKKHKKGEILNDKPAKVGEKPKNWDGSNVTKENIDAKRRVFGKALDETKQSREEKSTECQDQAVTQVAIHDEGHKKKQKKSKKLHEESAKAEKNVENGDSSYVDKEDFHPQRDFSLHSDEMMHTSEGKVSKSQDRDVNQPDGPTKSDASADPERKTKAKLKKRKNKSIHDHEELEDQTNKVVDLKDKSRKKKKVHR